MCRTLTQHKLLTPSERRSAGRIGYTDFAATKLAPTINVSNTMPQSLQMLHHQQIITTFLKVACSPQAPFVQLSAVFQ